MNVVPFARVILLVCHAEAAFIFAIHATATTLQGVGGPARHCTQLAAGPSKSMQAKASLAASSKLLLSQILCML